MTKPAIPFPILLTSNERKEAEKPVIRTGTTALPPLFDHSDGRILPGTLLPSSRTGGQARDRLFSFFVHGSPELQDVVGRADELPFRPTRRKSSPHEPGRTLDGLDLTEDSLHHAASPFQDLPGPIALHLLLERRGRLFLRFGPILSLSSPGLPEGVEKELRHFHLFFRDRLFVPISGIGHDLPGGLVNACCLQGVSGRFQHGKQLMLV